MRDIFVITLLMIGMSTANASGFSDFVKGVDAVNDLLQGTNQNSQNSNNQNNWPTNNSSQGNVRNSVRADYTEIVGGSDYYEATYAANTQGWSIYKGTRQGGFSYCVAEKILQGDAIRLGYGNQQWQLAIPANNPVKNWAGELQVDNYRRSASGSATDQAIVVWLSLGELDQIKKGNQLRLHVGRNDITRYYPLSGSTAAIETVKQCVNSGSGQVVFQQNNNNYQSSFNNNSQQNRVSYKRIYNRWKSNEYLVVDDGIYTTSSPDDSGFLSAEWVIEPVGKFVRIKSRGRNEYLLFYGGTLGWGPANLDDLSSHWSLKTVENGPYKWIENRLRKGNYIHIENGDAEAGWIKPGAWSGHWLIK